MPVFTAISDQAPPIRILRTLLTKGTIPHALLFTGIDGIGKRMTALAFAMACNCKGVPREKIGPGSGGPVTEPCGKCGSCHKIESGNHPDVIQVSPEGKIIRISQIRSLLETLAMKPFEAITRVVLLTDAQTLNPGAGNALLKLLEEPPDHTVFILTAPQNSDLLATIASRCQLVRFRPVSTGSIVKMLVETHKTHPDDAEIMARMAAGSFSKAIRLHRNGWLRHRNWLIDQLVCIADTPTTSLLAAAERIAAGSETLADGLDIIKSWMRDLLVRRSAPELVLNRDMDQQIKQESNRLTDTSILSILRMVDIIENRIVSNGNTRLNVEVLLLQIAAAQAGSR